MSPRPRSLARGSRDVFGTGKTVNFLRGPGGSSKMAGVTHSGENHNGLWPEPAAEPSPKIIVQKYGVSLSHGSGGDRLMATLLRIIEALRAEHLHIWDPQRGDWLPAD